MLLETRRLFLRALEETDLDPLRGVLGDPETMAFYPHPFSREEVERWIAVNRQRYERDGHGLWAIVLRETDELIGDCGLVVQDVEGILEVEVGWHVRRDLWGRGLATEAGRACLDHAFATLGMERVISLIRPENLASRRVAEKLGMEVEAETRRGALMWRHLVYVGHRDG